MYVLNFLSCVVFTLFSPGELNYSSTWMHQWISRFSDCYNNSFDINTFLCFYYSLLRWRLYSIQSMLHIQESSFWRYRVYHYESFKWEINNAVQQHKRQLDRIHSLFSWSGKKLEQWSLWCNTKSIWKENILYRQHWLDPAGKFFLIFLKIKFTTWMLGTCTYTIASVMAEVHLD